MAKEDDENLKDEVASKSPEGDRDHDWKETCIGIWSRSAVGQKIDEDGKGRICNGISVVRIGQNADPKKVKLSQTRGLQIIIQETGDEGSNNDQKKNSNQLHERNRRGREMDETSSLTQRVMEVMVKKTDGLQKSVEHYRTEGVTASDVWDGVKSFCSKTYKTSTRLISYVKPQDKFNQMYNFASERAKNLASWWSGNGKN